MFQSVQPFLNGQSCRAADTTSRVFEDVEGTLDWLSADKISNGPSAALGPYGHTVRAFDDDSTAERTTEALEWSGVSLPGHQVVLVAAHPSDTFEAIRGFFEGDVATVLEEKAWEMSALAFVAFVPIDIEVGVYSTKDAATSASSTVITFQHTSQRDVVRFHQLWHSAMGYLVEKGYLVTPMNHASAAAPNFLSPTAACAFMEDDLFDEPEMSWHVRAAAALDTAASINSSLREEGLQMLASWAEGKPESRAAIAEALGERLGLVRTLMRRQTTLAVLYPLAVTLKLVALQSSVPSSVAELIAQASGLPPIVARELEEARKNLAAPVEKGAKTSR